MNRRKEYENRQKAAGLKKVTVWVPEGVVVDFQLQAEICRNHRSLFPHMLRDQITGQFISPNNSKLNEVK